MPDFNILQQPNFAQAALGGFQAGQALGKQKRLDAALGQVDLSRPETIVPILQIDPATGTSLMSAAAGVRKQADQTRTREILPQAALGDKAAINELWGLDSEIAGKLTKDHTDHIDKGVKAAGNIAIGLLQLPEGQRAAAWDAGIDTLDESYPELAQFKGQYSPTNLQSVLAQAGMSKDAVDITSPKYQAVVPGGTLAQTNSLAGPVYSAATATEDDAPAQAPSGSSSAPRSVRNNNPGNIEDGKFAKAQPGYKGTDGRFAIFEDAGTGAKAQGALLGSYIDRGFNTVEKIIKRWAPHSDGNDTAAYIAQVAKSLNVSPGDTLSKAAIPQLQRVITGVESGSGPSSGRTVAKAGLSAPRVGTERAGAGGARYRFKGGDPANRASWESVSG